MGTAVCSNDDFATIIGYIKLVYSILLIAVPIVLLLMGTIDLLKAVSSGDDKAVKAATSMLGKRAAAAAGVFLFIMIVRLLTGVVGNQDWKTCWDAGKTATISGGGSQTPTPPADIDD